MLTLSAKASDLVLQEAEKSSVYLRFKTNGGIGSGVVVRSDETGTYVLTNKHVCDAIPKVEGSVTEYDVIYFVQVTKGKHHNEKYLAQVIKSSYTFDLCLIHSFKKGKLKGIELAKSELKFGENACNLGNPLRNKGVFRCGATLKYEATKGQFLRSIDINTNKGSSGSGIFNKKGQLSGIICQLDQRGKRGLYVPLTYIKFFLGNLID